MGAGPAQARGAQARGAQARGAPAQAAARALPGMMLQDGSRRVGPRSMVGAHHGRATSEIYSAFFVDEEGTMSSFCPR